MEKKIITVIGTYWKTLFRNQESGAALFEIVPNQRMEGTVDSILTCQGYVSIYAPKMPIQLTGYYQNGRFHVKSDSLPYATRENTLSMLEYLAPSLSPTQAVSIAEAANNDLFQFAMRSDAEEVMASVLKRSKTGALVAHRMLLKIKDLSDGNELEKKLLSYGVPFDRIEYFRKKGISLAQLKKTPYRLFLAARIPIRIADDFAKTECGILDNSVERIIGFVQSTLLNLLEAGNTCVTLEILTKVTLKRMQGQTSEDMVLPLSPYLIHMAVQYSPKLCGYHLVNGEPLIYINHVWEEEQLIVHHLKRLQRSTKQYCFTQASINEIEDNLQIKYNSGQRSAFELLRSGGVKILTGPPGSGKTAVIKGLIQYFEKNGNGSVSLAASTGMAAKVMSRACNNQESKTVNLLVNVIPFQDSIRSKDLNDPVEADLIIVDEVSMIGVQLFSALVKAIRNDAILLLVGDENQLQSVEYGNVLHDLIGSGKVEVCRLTEILRQSGTICDNAKKINTGQLQIQTDPSFQVFQCSDADQVLYLLKQHYHDERSQIITPIKKTSAGTIVLNTVFQKRKNQLLTIYGKKHFYQQDKVIAIKTNYEKGYINGDIGYLIDKTAQEGLLVNFSGRIVAFSRNELCDLDLAYAITIHKSQGSEFDEVHIILPTEADHMMSRRLIYTAITRAKKKVYLYNIGDSFRHAVLNVREQQRFTRLREQLI